MGQTPPSATLEVFDTLEELREEVPAELADLVEAHATDSEVAGLHKRYGAQAVLDGLDLTVPAGTVTALLVGRA